MLQYPNQLFPRHFGLLCRHEDLQSCVTGFLGRLVIGVEPTSLIPNEAIGTDSIESEDELDLEKWMPLLTSTILERQLSVMRLARGLSPRR